MPGRTLNLGILAHVDAGKTTLTERLLYAAGVIDEIGSVDDGSTQTDSLALERQRGITIKSAVVSFAIGDVAVNLIDTPGHPDFIAEVERVLSVLDGAVLVISAVEGVQAQTRVLMRALQRLGLPVLIFVNKTDRRGADCERVLRQIAQRLTPAIVAMGSVTGLGGRDCEFIPHGPDDPAFLVTLTEALAERDDALLAAYLDDEARVGYEVLTGQLAAQARRGLVHPVFFGSAVTGAGAGALMAGLAELLPTEAGDPDGPVAGTVFKVERGPAGERIAYVRMFRGTLRVRDRLELGQGRAGKITAIGVPGGAAGGAGSAGAAAGQVTAGQIGKLWGLREVQVGDTIGVPGGVVAASGHFATPTLETAVEPCRPADRAALHLALTQLAEQDPLINLRQDELRRQLLVSLYGEVQKEVIGATLAGDYGIEVSFSETSTICIERPAGTGAAAELMGSDGNPFRATAGLRVDPAAIGSGIRFRLEIELGALPAAFIRAVDETVHRTLAEGLSGWQVTDCTVTLTHSGYVPPPPYGWSSMSSSGADFRNLTPMVAMTALDRAGSRVHEPMHRFRLEVPADTLGSVLPALAPLRAVPAAGPAVRGSLCLLDGEIPAARVHDLQRQLPSLTRGEGVLESAFDHYRPVTGEIPVRPRTSPDPRHRKEYLMHVSKAVSQSYQGRRHHGGGWD